MKCMYLDWKCIKMAYSYIKTGTYSISINSQDIDNLVHKTELIRATEINFSETDLFFLLNKWIVFINVRYDSRQNITSEVNKVHHSIRAKFVTVFNFISWAIVLNMCNNCFYNGC